MPSPDPKYYLWMDLETTGLDPAMDPPLEVAVLVTTPDLIEVPGTRFQALMPLDEWARLRLSETPFVENMHKDNGLLSEIERGIPMMHEGVENSILSILQSLSDDPKPVFLAGTGVAAFDIHVLRTWMPRLADYLDYRTIDVGQIRRFLKYVLNVKGEWMPEEADNNHRAQGDLLNSLNQARELMTMIGDGFDLLEAKEDAER